ncbi:putative porin [Catenovulum sp. SM1970]|uniref:putative porin n=1 Tax=Marinifaba aquimaris TaxID=2741323 RepID=UPI001572FDFD|nr:putative porin [Marinifaba aquimaris]NTS76416.1 putative porin [Marinifaba aquimaris]
MKFKILAALVLASSSTMAAESYRSFSNLSYADNDYGDITLINTRYYLADQETLGPLDETGYLDTDTNFGGYFSTTDNVDNVGVDAEVFFGRFLVGAGYDYSDTDFSDSDTFSASVGYLMGDNIKFKVTGYDPEYGDSYFIFQAQYVHKLEGVDYLGFTFSTDDDTDLVSLSSYYFAALQNSQYVKAQLDMVDTDYDTYWSARGDFYFNAMTSVYLGADDNDNYTAGAQHYFTRNWAVAAEYVNNTDDSDASTIQARLTAQF